MSWKTEQFRPSPDVVMAVVERAVKPTVEATRRRLQIPQISARVSTWVGDESRFESCILLGATARESHPNAQLRLWFRHTFKPARQLFYAQLRMDAPDGKSSLAGLIVKGDVKVDDDEIVVGSTSCTLIYNRCDWIGPA